MIHTISKAERAYREVHRAEMSLVRLLHPVDGSALDIRAIRDAELAVIAAIRDGQAAGVSFNRQALVTRAASADAGAAEQDYARRILLKKPRLPRRARTLLAWGMALIVATCVLTTEGMPAAPLLALFGAAVAYMYTERFLVDFLPTPIDHLAWHAAVGDSTLRDTFPGTDEERREFDACVRWWSLRRRSSGLSAIGISRPPRL
jgi:hypothetical protein